MPNHDITVQAERTYSATDTATEAGRLVRAAFDVPGGLAGTEGRIAMNNARVLMDLATVQARAESAHALKILAQIAHDTTTVTTGK